jgi:hypothetical protein
VYLLVKTKARQHSYADKAKKPIANKARRGRYKYWQIYKPTNNRFQDRLKVREREREGEREGEIKT